MATINWTGSAGDGNFATTSNWSTGKLPGATDTVKVAANLSSYPTLSATATIGALDLAIGSQFTVASGGALTVSALLPGINSGTIALAGGSLSVSSAYTNLGVISGYGSLTLGPLGLLNTGTVDASGGTLSVTGVVAGGSLLVGSAATDTLVVNSSSLVSSVSYLSPGGQGVISVAAPAILTVNGGGPISVGTNTLNVNGAISDVFGITLAGGAVTGSGRIIQGTNLSGHGSCSLAITGNEVISASGGTLSLTGLVDQTGGATSLDITNGATLAFTNANGIGTATIQPTLTFQGAAGVFSDTAVSASSIHLASISGFSGSDQIQIAAFGTGDTFTVNGSTLTISNGSSSASFSFTAVTNLAGFKVTDVGGIDTITICFLTGTHIRTPTGEVPIEGLRPGDPVLTSEGAVRPVRWIGRQTVGYGDRDPIRTQPIRICAHALADDIPCRDLFVSPDHAILIDDCLVQAAALVNGSTIRRVTDVPPVFTYYHLELDNHELILAEAVPAETFIDNVDRRNFDNWQEFDALFPSGKSMLELPNPRAASQRQVPERIRKLLAQRARMLGGEHAVLTPRVDLPLAANG